jgi:hypothetical protein
MKLVAMGVLGVALCAGCAMETVDSPGKTGVVDTSSGSGTTNNSAGRSAGIPQGNLTPLSAGAPAENAGSAGTTNQPQPCPWSPIGGSLGSSGISGGDPNPNPQGSGPTDGLGSTVTTPRNIAGHWNEKNACSP